MVVSRLVASGAGASGYFGAGNLQVDKRRNGHAIRCENAPQALPVSCVKTCGVYLSKPIWGSVQSVKRISRFVRYRSAFCAQVCVKPGDISAGENNHLPIFV